MVDAIPSYQRSSYVPSMRLEFEAPEESKIRDLERQIDDDRRKGNQVDRLIEERKRIYDSWIDRLDKEIAGATDQPDRDRLERQRERAMREYG
jgi:hypothetical protein